MRTKRANQTPVFSLNIFWFFLSENKSRKTHIILKDNRWCVAWCYTCFTRPCHCRSVVWRYCLGGFQRFRQMALLRTPTFFFPPGFPSFCLSPLSPIFLLLKIPVLIALVSCWQLLLWYLDSPLFASSGGGKGEKTSRYLWVFGWCSLGCPHGLRENG